MKRLDQNKRLYKIDQKIIAITGSLASGKSSFTQLFQEKGFFTLSADDLIKEIYKEDQTKKLIKSLSPSSISHNQINFKDLREKFFDDNILKKKLEDFLHHKIEFLFKKKINEFNPPVVIYEIPLLFEKKLEHYVDFIVTVICNEKFQYERARIRDQIDEKLISKIIDKQIDINIKKEKSDFVVSNNKTIEHLNEPFNQLIELHLKRYLS